METDLYRVLKEHYGLDLTQESIARLKEPTASSVVYKALLSDRSEIFIKDSFWYSDAISQEALEKAHGVSELLMGKGVLLPKMLKGANGKFVAAIGNRNIVVMEYVGGAKFSSRDEEYAASGAALGAFHKAGKEYLEKYPNERVAIAKIIPAEKPYEESERLYRKSLRQDLLAPHKCDVEEVCEFVRRNIDVIDETIQFINKSSVNAPSRASGLVHNDFNFENVIFSSAGKVVAILDCDQMGIAPYIWDVGNTLASFLWKSLKQDTGTNVEAKTRLFLAGYHKIFPLPIDEYSLILAATQRWDIMRILRSLRRHHYENNRLPALLLKIQDRLIPRIKEASRIFSFIAIDWLEKVIGDNAKKRFS